MSPQLALILVDLDDVLRAQGRPEIVRAKRRHQCLDPAHVLRDRVSVLASWWVPHGGLPRRTRRLVGGMDPNANGLGPGPSPFGCLSPYEYFGL